MKLSLVPVGLLALSAIFQASGADSATDPLTRLALPTSGAPLLLGDSPDRYDDVQVCKSKGAMMFYPARRGTVSAAVAWYAAHLRGFRHTHGIDVGRSQDTFYNATGTLTVSITGEPRQEGHDANVYSVIYLTIQPGVSAALIEGLNLEKFECP
jgi:hypothetical protein